MGHGKEVVLLLQNIKNGLLQCQGRMSSFRIQAMRLRPTSGTLMSKRVLAVQDHLHHFFVTAILWTVHTFQAMAEVVHSQQTTLYILIAMFQWRVFVNFRGIARNFNSKRNVFVDGPMGFKTRLWVIRRKSKVGSQA